MNSHVEVYIYSHQVSQSPTRVYPWPPTVVTEMFHNARNCLWLGRARYRGLLLP